MSSKKRPLIGRRELQALAASGDALPASRASWKEKLAAASNCTSPISPIALQIPAVINLRPCGGQFGLPTNNNSLETLRGVKEEYITRGGYQTRGVIANRRTRDTQVDFGFRFRGLPAEVKHMIFTLAIDRNCKKAPALIVGLRTRQNDPDEGLYKAAWRAFCSQNTFVLSRSNNYTINQDLKGAMPRFVWETVINLEIKHE